MYTTLLRMSALVDFLARSPGLFASKYIYGGPAYGISNYIMSGFKGAAISAEQREFNKRMSRVRQAVEWNFMLMKSNWLS
ncbi:hypothetical protein AC1031_014402 [Aphanomyces cochlioides]|nr:hypothetical protein AC1031_014402 [Aphanomyces cochlioides]